MDSLTVCIAPLHVGQEECVWCSSTRAKTSTTCSNVSRLSVSSLCFLPTEFGPNWATLRTETTFSPSQAPTAKPTVAPTYAPTFVPTFQPTAQPTQTPTRPIPPTPAPTTATPTVEPTSAPTPAITNVCEGRGNTLSLLETEEGQTHAVEDHG